MTHVPADHFERVEEQLRDEVRCSRSRGRGAPQAADSAAQGVFIGREVAKGGFGIVYEAQDRNGRVFAAKVMSRGFLDSVGMTERVRNEIKLLSTVRHAHIVRYVVRSRAGARC